MTFYDLLLFILKVQSVPYTFCWLKCHLASKNAKILRLRNCKCRITLFLTITNHATSYSLWFQTEKTEKARYYPKEDTKKERRENQRGGKYSTFATFKRYWISPEETIEIIKRHRHIEENEFIEETILPSKCVLQTNATNKKMANVI